MRSRRALRTGSFAAAIVVPWGVLASGLALGDAAPVHLIYERGPGAEQCPDETALRADVAARLGRDPFVEEGARTVVARIRKVGAELRATIELRDEGGTKGVRTLSGAPDCSELSSALALAVSLAVDPIAATTPKPEPSASTSASSPPSSPSVAPTPSASGAPTVPRPVVIVAPRPEPPPRDLGGPRVAIGVHGALGVVPTTTFGATAAFGWVAPTWSVDLEGRRDLPATAAVGTGTATASVLAVSIVPCLRRGLFAACALGSFGALQSTGEGLPVNRTDTAPWIVAGVRGALEVPIARAFTIGVAFDLITPIVRTTYRIDGRDAWTTPAVAGSLGIRVGAHFP